MPLNVRVSYEEITEQTLSNCGEACGTAVRNALDGATSVVLIDTNGLRYNVWAEPVEDNS